MSKKKPKTCKHIEGIKAQLKDKDWGILRKDSKFDWFEQFKLKED